ncbi:marR family protein [bacterium BMS3Bbin01]|nr:marR family protein [bacterium BMS3Bbin01]
MSGTLLPIVRSTGSPPRAFAAAVDLLRGQLPSGWSVEVEFDRQVRPRSEATITITPPGVDRPIRFVAAYYERLTPRDAAAVTEGFRTRLGGQPGVHGLVVAPWVSRRTRDVLRSSGVGVVDLTGTVDLAVDDPTLVLRIDGADRNPIRRSAPSPNLRGAKAWALMKTLIEVSPPYGIRELAAAVGVDPGYTSRIVKALEDERLVERVRRGPIVQTDWEGLLAQLTTTYHVFDANETSRWVTGDVVRNLPARLARTGLEQPWALTGSLAAGRIAPVAAPGIAVVYTDDPDEVVEALGLLPAESGANVVLARPYDRAALARRWVFDGVWFVSPAQTAADCLTGSGRMPAEGEALVEWMRSHEDRWRANDFAASPDPLSP